MYYAEWCNAVSRGRAKLEAARDARAGKLGDPKVTKQFNDALNAFQDAVRLHKAETRCDKMH